MVPVFHPPPQTMTQKVTPSTSILTASFSGHHMEDFSAKSRVYTWEKAKEMPSSNKSTNSPENLQSQLNKHEYLCLKQVELLLGEAGCCANQDLLLSLIGQGPRWQMSCRVQEISTQVSLACFTSAYDISKFLWSRDLSERMPFFSFFPHCNNV
jgi:hypothetical protein